jgi:type II secretory pathway pseudopilin PulG
MPAWKDRRRAQAGTTLVELLVSMTIVGLALVLIVGTFSTGLLDATLAKRNTSVQAVSQYELDRIGASPFSPSAASYSECFATESPTAPTVLANFSDPCPSGSALRAEVTLTQSPTPTTQVWKITVKTPDGSAAIGSPLSTYKVAR